VPWLSRVETAWIAFSFSRRVSSRGDDLDRIAHLWQDLLGIVGQLGTSLLLSQSRQLSLSQCHPPKELTLLLGDDHGLR
jgi:hypothetical protein